MPITKLDPAALPSRDPARDKFIVGKINEVIDAVNARDLVIGKLVDDDTDHEMRIKVLEGDFRPVPPEPAPVPVPEPTPAPSPAPTGAAAKILAVVGETESVAATIALGGVFAQYEQNFARTAGGTATTGAEEFNYYYDRALLYYTRHARGDVSADYLAKAHAQVQRYFRTQFPDPVWNPPPQHWVFPDGVELYHRLTGDGSARDWLLRAYAHSLHGIYSKGELNKLSSATPGYMENRIQARCLHAMLANWRMGGVYANPHDGVTYDQTKFAQWLPDALTQILASQQADGSFKYYFNGGFQLNYMVGILADVLIEYHRDFQADPRILPFIQKAYDYLFATQWNATDQAFRYGSAAGDVGLAGDLNGLLVNGLGFLYQQTRDPVWRTRGDSVLAGLVSPMWDVLMAGKQWNQAWAVSARYFGLRR